MAKIDTVRYRKPTLAAGTDLPHERKQITIVLTKRQFKAVSTYAKRSGVSFAEAVRQAVNTAYV